MNPKLLSIPHIQRRGSRARCVLLTDGNNEIVAKRFNELVSPWATIDPMRHFWMPRGPLEPGEATGKDFARFTSVSHYEEILNWWLVVRRRTPHWDFASGATIQGSEGLVLIE